MFMDTLFPTHFAALALAHFVALLSPGPDFFLLTAYGLRYRLRGSLGICVGIALGNGVYIVLAIAGWAGMQQAPWLFSLIQTAGALYLLWIGSQLLRSSARTTPLLATDAPSPPTWGRQLSLGLGSSLLNPKNMLFYLSLMTGLLGPTVTLVQKIVSGGWMFSIVLLWDLALVAAIARPQVQRTLPRALFLVERVAGAILLLFGLVVLFGR